MGSWTNGPVRPFVFFGLEKMSILDALILGIVQGVSEWLPISSSGHLVVFRELFGLEGSVSYDIFLHFSAIFVIIVFFNRELSAVVRALFSFKRDSYEFRLAVYILYATVVTCVVGLLLSPHISGLASLKVVRFTFLVTSLLLFLSRRGGSGRITLKTAIFTGLFQAMALFPGISRSGATISAARIAGAGREDAFRFSFLMALPAMAGAVILEIGEFRAMAPGILVTGFFTSLLLGLASLYLLRRILIRGRFHLFGYYTLALSLLLFIVDIARSL